jgi:hypothetical protein
MKKKLKPLIVIAFISPIFTFAQKQNFKDTIFIKNYFPTEKVSYLYSKPNISAKTKIKIPPKVMVTTINKSGNFEYGDFSVSSNKSYRGWFLVSHLQRVVFTPPKVVK